ncbi:MAG: RNA-guided endonuclease TnpB family protein [Candidatus Sericytochromatia bacterium]
MNTVKTFHYKLKPNKTQESMLNQWLGTCRYLYNVALEYKKLTYEQKGISLSKYDLIKELPNVKKTEGFEWFKNVPSQTLQAVIERLDNSYQRFFRFGTGFPKFAKKHKYKSFLIKQGVEIWENCIKLPKIGLIKFFNSRPVESKIKNATIRKEADGWYISLVFEGKTKELNPIDKETGLDLGLKYFGVTSNDEKIDNPRTYRKYQKVLAKAQRVFSRTKKGSNNRKKVSEKIAKIHQKISNVRKDFLSKTSTKLISENQAIVVEDLQISNLLKNPKPIVHESGKGYKKNGKSKKTGLNKSILDAGWGMFTNMLEYKAKWCGRVFVKVAPNYTSRDCSNCGFRLEKLALSIRQWECPQCFVIHDRDTNASKNILKKWKESL